jgi:hypothetical protein
LTFFYSATVKFVCHFAVLLLLVSIASPMVVAMAVCAHPEEMTACEHCRHMAATILGVSVGDGQPMTCCHLSNAPLAPKAVVTLPQTVQGAVVPQIAMGSIDVRPEQEHGSHNVVQAPSGRERQVLLCIFLI